MFPGISLPRFEEAMDPKRIISDDITKMFDQFGFYYSIGLFRQMAVLNELSNQLFRELEAEIDSLNTRISHLGNRIEDLGAKADQVIAANALLTPEDFCRQPYSLNEFSHSPINTEDILAHADDYVKPLIQAAGPRPSFQPFASLLPNYEELDRMISDPSLFETQYREELLVRMRQYHENMESRRRGSICQQTVESSESPKRTSPEPPRVTIIRPIYNELITPPPPGQTQNWRNYRGTCEPDELVDPIETEVWNEEEEVDKDNTQEQAPYVPMADVSEAAEAPAEEEEERAEESAPSPPVELSRKTAPRPPSSAPGAPGLEMGRRTERVRYGSDGDGLIGRLSGTRRAATSGQDSTSSRNEEEDDSW